MLQTHALRFTLAAAFAVAGSATGSHADTIDPSTWGGDARHMVAAVDSLHPRPYRWNHRAAFDSAAADFEQRLPALRYDQAVAGLSRILGMLHDGHSRLDQVRLASHSQPTLAPLPGPGLDVAYPIGFGVFADGLWIVRATSAHADDASRVPLPLTRSLPAPFGFADLGDSAHTVFARIREIADAPAGERLAQFAARLFSHVDSVGSRRLILDLRANGGGNNYLNQPLVHGVIMRPVLDRPGGVFVIVDRGTFSAAVSLAADLERETHALFVGEPTGGAPNSFGDPAHVTLPASGLIVRISTLPWTGSDPRDPREFIAPDLPAMGTYADWLGHRDPALAAIARYRPAADAPDVPPNTRWGDSKKLEARVPAIAWQGGGPGDCPPTAAPARRCAPVRAACAPAGPTTR